MARAGGDARIGGIFALCGDKQIKRSRGAGRRYGGAGAAGAFRHRRAPVHRQGRRRPRAQIETLTPVYRLAIEAPDRKDEVKLTAAIAKLCEEDPVAGVRAECRNP